MTFPYAELQVKIILTLQTPPGETYKLMNMRIITSLTTSIKVLTAIKQLRRSALRDHILSPTLELYRLTPLNNRPICSKVISTNNKFFFVIPINFVLLNRVI